MINFYVERCWITNSSWIETSWIVVTDLSPRINKGAQLSVTAVCGDSDVGDIVILVTIWWWLISDVGGRIIMLVTFFVMLVIFSMY